ncbi:hypothetical protein Bbelb_175630 [Branchiostoma belcheri]|nr:hypothetical protein Bbelb_175630 [Branchiostoma belcheri]
MFGLVFTAGRSRLARRHHRIERFWKAVLSAPTALFVLQLSTEIGVGWLGNDPVGMTERRASLLVTNIFLPPDATDVRHGVPVLRGDFTLIGQGDAELLEQPASFKPDVPIQEMNRDELATQIFILGLTGRDPKEQFTSTRHISRKDGRTSDHQPTGRAGRHSRSQSKLRRSPDCSKPFDCGNPAEKNKSPDGWENFDFENPAAGALVAPVPERSFFNSG